MLTQRTAAKFTVSSRGARDQASSTLLVDAEIVEVNHCPRSRPEGRLARSYDGVVFRLKQLAVPEQHPEVGSAKNHLGHIPLPRPQLVRDADPPRPVSNHGHRVSLPILHTEERNVFLIDAEVQQ